MSSPLEPVGQNGKGQFLYLAGFDRVIEFTLQDGKLLTQHQDFQIFFLIGQSPDVEDG